MYSDADIILSKDWVPPITIAPTQVSSGSSDQSDSPVRKKTSSVSFSLDSAGGPEAEVPPPVPCAVVPPPPCNKEDSGDRGESRKNKVKMLVAALIVVNS